jgi:hypothetical protein
LPLTRTLRKLLTCGFVTPWLSLALRVPRDRARSVHGACATAWGERDIAELITAYRDSATAASLATTHGVSLRSVKRLLHTAGVRRTPPVQRSTKATPTATHP